MQRIYSIAIIAAGLIFIVGGAVIVSDNIHKNNAAPVSTETEGEKDLAADIIWNAYSMQGGLFIYPAEWILTETKTEVDKKMVVTSFRVHSSIDTHAISVEHGCANADADAIDNSDCVKGFLMRAEDDTPLTLAVYAHMKAFIMDPTSEAGKENAMITPELITYIETELRRSVAKDAIQNALIGAGWKATEVAEALHIVDERAIKGETAPYVPAVIIHPSTPDPVTLSSQLKEGGAETVVKQDGTSNHLEQFVGMTVPQEKKSPIVPLLIISAVLILFGIGYVFIKPLLTSPKTYVGLIEKEITTAKSITFSGNYEITAPAALIFPDPVLLSSFGGIVARTQTAKIKASFFGTDDWYDLRAKKSETKINASASVATSKEISFPSSIRRVSESLYAKLPETGALFDPTATAAGANWLRYDKDDFVPLYAYGFLGNTKLYENALPRFLMPIFANAVTVGEPTSVPPLSTLTVVYDAKTITEIFSESLFNGDAFQNSQVFTSRYTITGFSESPHGELSFDENKMLRKASIVFGFNTKEYTVPVHVSFNLSFDVYNTPPAINIPTQVISLAELKKQSALLTVPEGLRPFFTDIHTITSIFKGTNKDSFKGVCADTDGTGADESALTISVVTSKLSEAGYGGGVCKDTPTAWMYYVPNPADSTFFCTDSRDFSGKTSREPIGDKCN